ncbi:MAG: ATP cone domain-containing protein [Candidatus Micrarchaeaceae archaeon]
MKVKRRNGKVEDFIREKIVVAVVKAGGNINMARTIANEIESELKNKDTVTTEEIRGAVLSKLETRDPKTYDSWIKFDKERKGK